MGWSYHSARIAVDPTGWTTNAWTTLDLTGTVAAGSKAVALYVIQGGTTDNVNFRPTGCTTAETPVIRLNFPRFYILPLDNDQTLQYYVETTNFDIFIVAESDDRTGLVTGDYTDLFAGATSGVYTAASPSGLGTEEFALIGCRNTSTTEYNLSLQETGDPYYQIGSTQWTTGFAHASGGEIDFKRASSSLLGYYLGYIPSLKQVTRTAYGASQSNAWDTVTLAALPTGATMALLHVHQPNDATFGIRMVGSSDGLVDNPTLSGGNQLWWLIGVDESKEFQFYTSDHANVTIDLIGYYMDAVAISVSGIPQIVWNAFPGDASSGKSGGRCSFEIEIEFRL